MRTLIEIAAFAVMAAVWTLPVVLTLNEPAEVQAAIDDKMAVFRWTGLVWYIVLTLESFRRRPVTRWPHEPLSDVLTPDGVAHQMEIGRDLLAGVKLAAVSFLFAVEWVNIMRRLSTGTTDDVAWPWLIWMAPAYLLGVVYCIRSWKNAEHHGKPQMHSQEEPPQDRL